MMDSSVDYRERPKKIEVEQEQIVSDEELFDSVEVDPKKLDKLSLTKIVDIVILFGNILSGFEFYKYELEYAKRIIYSLVSDDGETITGLFCRQSGKSFTSSIVAPSTAIFLPLLAQAFKSMGITDHRIKPMYKFVNGLWVGVYGPDYDRAAIIGNKINNTLSSDRAKEILSEPDIGMVFPKKLSSYINCLPRGSIIKVKSANKKVSIEGDTFHMLITDETQEINDYVIKKSMSPFLASTNGTTVHNGSTYHKKVYFYDVCKLNKRKDLDRKKKSRCHFEYDYKIAQKYNPNYKKYIIREKEKLGEFSDEFRMSYELYWPIEKGMFITEDFLVGHLGRDYYVANADMFNDHCISIDIAKILDSTVITVIQPDWDNPILVDPEAKTFRYFKKIKNWLELSGSDYDAQFFYICDFLKNFKWSILVVDATGVGAPMYDRFYNKYANEQDKTVYPFIFTTQSKSDGYTLLGRELLSERIIYPNSIASQELRKQKKFVQQMISLEKQMRGAFLNVVPIQEEGFDDYADSLMMNVWAIEEAEFNSQIEDYGNQNIYKVNAEVARLNALGAMNPEYKKYLEKIGVVDETTSKGLVSAIHRENKYEKSFLMKRE